MGAPVITITSGQAEGHFPAEWPPASAFRRIASLAYDALLVAGIVMITSFLLIIARNTAVPPGTGWFQVFVAVQFASYFIVFWSFGGQTPGMRAWSLQLRMRDGEPVPVRAAAARFLFGCLSFAAGGIGFLAIIRDPDRQTWHDRAVGTRLVYARSRDGHR